MSFRFADPSYFAALLGILILIVLAFLQDRSVKQKLAKHFAEPILLQLTTSLDRSRVWIKRVLTFACLVFLVIALARPQMGQSTQKVKSEGVEIIFAVDVSESMMAEDLRPSRLELAKSELGRLVDLMPGNRVGVIAFAGSAALISPLTNDPGAVKMFLDSLSPLSVSSQGTSFSEALKLAEQAFERGGNSTDTTSKVTRVILISSDGEDHEPGALDAAKKLVDKGVRIFTVAYGTEKGGTIPVRDQMGFLKGYKKDNQGQVVITTVKGDELKALAEAGQGGFYFATAGGNQTQQIMGDINQLEKAEFDTAVATQYNEFFQIFLAIGILIGLIEIVISQKKKGDGIWSGRFMGGSK